MQRDRCSRAMFLKGIESQDSLVEMQIMISWGVGRNWDSENKTSSQVMLILSITSHILRCKYNMWKYSKILLYLPIQACKFYPDHNSCCFLRRWILSKYIVKYFIIFTLYMIFNPIILINNTKLGLLHYFFFFKQQTITKLFETTKAPGRVNFFHPMGLISC